MPSNESKTSREVLEFLYFDETLSKVMKLSNCLTINPNYLLFGRGGIGKNSIAKLAAFVSNLNYQEAQL